jgi:predicted Zn-dependent protease with MMP-like domain
MQRYYSEFWLAYAAGAPLGPLWARHTAPDLQRFEEMSIDAWMRLPHAEHERIVGVYTDAGRPVRLSRSAGYTK